MDVACIESIWHGKSQFEYLNCNFDSLFRLGWAKHYYVNHATVKLSLCFFCFHYLFYSNCCCCWMNCGAIFRKCILIGFTFRMFGRFKWPAIFMLITIQTIEELKKPQFYSSQKFLLISCYSFRFQHHVSHAVRMMNRNAHNIQNK